MEGGLEELAVVLNPAAHDRIQHVRQILDGFVALPMNVPASHFPAHLGRGIIANPWGETDEVPSPTVLRPPWSKRVAEKVKLLVFMPTSVAVILAIDDFRLLRMKLQFALGEPLLDAP